MNAEKKDQGRSCKPFKFDLALSVLSAFICVLLLCAVCPAQIHPHSFSPRQLGIMQAWYRADAVTALADGDPVASWVDSTANARTLAQGTADYRPAYKVSIQNGRPAIRFDGTNDYMSGTGFTLAQCTILTVQRPDVLCANLCSLWRVADDRGPFMVQRPSVIGVGFRRTDYSFFSLDAPNVASLTVPEVWSWAYDGITSAVYVDGTLVGSVDESGIPVASVQQAIGGWGGPANYPWSGDIHEIIVLNAAGSDRDRQRVERYLARKWGL